MIKMNESYSKLKPSYLFSEISKRVAAFSKDHTEPSLIRLGIGDVTEPLPQACVSALHTAAEEMSRAETFRGYGPEQGYSFLREAIAREDFTARGAEISPEDIFISDGSKCDSANFQELFSQDITVAISNPVYPVYLDTNVMAGRHDRIMLLPSTEENGFIPEPPEKPADLVYLCFPNNPTGTTAGKEQLQKWVNWAIKNKSLLLFDAAYEAFIRNPEIPHSIFEIPGAKGVAVEFRSFSKTAGFTGLRCAYTVVPEECTVYDSSGRSHSLRNLWSRRQTTKFNSVSYPVQRAAEAVYSPEGKKQVRRLADYYLSNADLIRRAFMEMGYSITGGEDSPYIWVKTGKESWEFFDFILTKAAVVCTPGSGFGSCGEGFVRISAFNKREKVEEALDRLKKILT